MKPEYKKFYEQFGLNVVYYRKKKRLTQMKLAELVDIDRSHISAIELGNVGVSFDVISSSATSWRLRLNNFSILEISTHPFYTFLHSKRRKRSVRSRLFSMFILIFP